ncbi:MAG TPA: DUF3108 domain-containing protein [Pyrinomonadaceae bacterium]|nr:DUF3108 domain-containing protein [Pyrinomonadaceae bacterium]
MNLSLKPPVTATQILFLAILLLALSFPVYAQNGGGGAFPFSQAPYQIGERLTYNVSYSNFPSAAHAEFQIVSRGNYFGRDAIQLRAHVETTGVVNVALLSLNNDYTSYVDPSTGLPFRSEETARDATNAADLVQDFSQPAGNEAIPPKRKNVSLGTYDLISALYRARALPLAAAAVYDFTVRGSTSLHHVELKVTGRETVNTNVGSFATIVTRVRVSNSPLHNVRVYFSDDERHVPVLITAEVGDGDLRAELAASEIVKPPPLPAPTPVNAEPGPVPAPTLPPATTPTAPPATENWPFKVGEQLNYQIFIGAGTTPLGIATFHVRGRQRYFDRDGFYFTVNANTTNAAAQIFVARDQVDSYVDPKALLPYRTVMNLIEGRRRFNQTLTLNQETGIATSDQGARIEMPVGTHDYVSFFYALRTFNLAPNRRNAISILVENKPKTLFVSSQKKEVIQLAGREMSAISLLITTDDPEPDKYQFRMWISDDPRRLPLRISFATQLGPLRADLAILPATPQ